MAITADDFTFLSRGHGGNKFGFSLRSGKAVEAVSIKPADLADLISVPTLILGTTSTDVTDGRISRTPPLAHPVFPWLYASNILDGQGIGVPTLQAADPDEELDVPSFPDAPFFEEYHLVVEFSPLPYAPRLDGDIVISKKTWTLPDGTTKTSKTANEWRRYTTFRVNSKQEAITAQQGQLVFRTGDGTSPGGIGATAFAGMPKIVLPNHLLTVRFFAIPYRFIESPKSYISQFAMQVNQFDWDTGKKVYPAGSLLYLGYDPSEPYTPPVQEIDQEEPGLFSYEKLCDCTLQFLLTTRAVDPDSAVDPATLNNANRLPVYHNAQPWFGDMNFYFVSTSGNDSDPTKWIPVFDSFPVELLFTDPDA